MLRPTLFTLALLPLVACGGGGGGGGSLPLTVEGTVRSPGGGAIGLSAGRARIAHGGPQAVELPGLLPVPDLTDVELVRVDPAGNVLSIIARGATVGGRYSFDLDGLNQEYSTRLVVRAGAGASEMRALVVGPEVDVDPLNEAVVRAFLQLAGRLDRLTFKEVDDFRASVEFLASMKELQAGADVPSTVDLVYQAVLAEPALVDYLALAAAEGQTSEGPGDIGGFFPAELGATWVLRGSRTVDGGTPEPFDTGRRVLLFEDGVATTAVSTPPDSGTPLFERTETTSTAIVDLGTQGADDPLQAFLPIDFVRFPIRLGESRVLFQGENVPVGGDLDGDGTADGMDVTAEQTAVGLEDVVTSSGTFEGCLRLERRLGTTLRLSGGAQGHSDTVVTRWYAPGLGLVRLSGEERVTMDDVQSTTLFAQSLREFGNGETGQGVLPPLSLVVGLPAGPDEERPGRPAVASGGTSHLVVTCREMTGVSQLVGTIVGPTGLGELEVPLVTLPTAECRPRPAVAFGGVYLVVYVQEDGASRRIRGVRVTRSGEVLDPGGFPISAGPDDTQPTVAFDDTKYTILWRREDAMQSGEIVGAYVSPEGGVLPEFTLHAAPGDQSRPSLVHADGIDFCVWEDSANGVSEVRGTRFDTLGTILGEPGFLVAEPADSEGDLEPRVASDGVGFLVAWLRTVSAATGTRHLVGVRVTLEGVIADADPLAIRAADVPMDSLSLTYDGENFACSWRTDSEGDGGGIHLARVSPEGLLADGSPTGPARVLAREPATATLSHPVLAMDPTGRGGLAVWLRTTSAEPATRTLEGARVFSF